MRDDVVLESKEQNNHIQTSDSLTERINTVKLVPPRINVARSLHYAHACKFHLAKGLDTRQHERIRVGNSDIIPYSNQIAYCSIQLC